MSDLRKLTAALVQGDADTILAAMGPEPVVNDQVLGLVKGKAEVVAWVADRHAWLTGLNAKPTELAFIATDQRVVHELSLAINTEDGAVDLPYVWVADVGPEGVVELRTYHSTWPYTKDHVFRAPPLAGRAAEPVPEIFQWYIDRIKVADVDAVLKRFTTEGYVREPSGNRWKHQGVEGRAAFYGHLVDAPRAQFDLSTSTVQGAHIAVEYAFAYGEQELVGGICIMQVEGDSIHAVRITDDVGV